MMGHMTETPVHTNEPTTAAAEPPSRWDRRDTSHRSGRIYRLAALVVVLAGIVLIIAVIFWSGFMLGAEGGDQGGDHHGDGGGGSAQQEGGSSQENGMMPFGVPMERAVPSAGFAG
jgi:hypothetical protein